MRRGKGRGWHGEPGRHRRAAKSGWNRKHGGPYRERKHHSSGELRVMKKQFTQLQKKMRDLEEKGEADSLKYEKLHSKAWKLFEELE